MNNVQVCAVECNNTQRIIQSNLWLSLSQQFLEWPLHYLSGWPLTPAAGGTGDKAGQRL